VTVYYQPDYISCGSPPHHSSYRLSECYEAVRLKPKWDAPRVEIANILVRFGKYDEALKGLEDAAHVLPNTTARLAYGLGFVKMMCNDLSGAVKMFELAIK